MLSAERSISLTTVAQMRAKSCADGYSANSFVPGFARSMWTGKISRAAIEKGSVGAH